MLNADQEVSLRFRPLNTQALRTLKLRALNPADTSWAAFNCYITSCIESMLHVLIYTVYSIIYCTAMDVNVLIVGKYVRKFVWLII